MVDRGSNFDLKQGEVTMLLEFKKIKLSHFPIECPFLIRLR